MTRVDFNEVKLAQGELRKALHGLDAVGTRRPAGLGALSADDLDGILEHLEAALIRLRTIRESIQAEER
jgi:hypothetical protein